MLMEVLLLLSPAHAGESTSWTPEQQAEARVLWQEWSDVLAPPQLAVAEREVAGAHFRCLPFEAQPAFRKGEVQRAVKAMLLYEAAIEAGSQLSLVEARAQAAAAVPISAEQAIPVVPATPPPPLPTADDEDDQVETVEPSEPLVEACPEGSIPIHVVPVDDIGEYGSYTEFVNRSEPGSSGSNDRIHVTFWNVEDRSYLGTEASVNLWNPFVDGGKKHFSLIQTWVMWGERNRDNPSLDTQQRIELGTQRVGNQNHPRTFVYTKVSPTDKCYEPCGHYVQHNSSPSQAPGRKWTTTSVTDGVQIFARMRVQLHEGRWWVGTLSEWMGYYPTGTFNAAGLGSGAERIWWGGEVTDILDETTQTDMGSGRFPSAGYGRAALLKNMREYRMNNTSVNYRVDKITDVPGCSEGAIGSLGSSYGTHVFLGGPNFRPSQPAACQP